MKKTILTISILIGISQFVHAQISPESSIPNSIRLRNASNSSNGYFDVDLTPWNDRVLRDLTIDLLNEYNKSWYFFNNYMDNGQLIEILNGNYGGSNRSENGNVEIGINDPTVKLSVKSTHLSKKVRGEVASCPDYVFIDSYELGDLSRLENFIPQISRLPDISIAGELAENGIVLEKMED